jgi:type IV pilus assembly protein PilB
MNEKRQLGAILLESGRITDADVQRVLEYQRAHGGFFGQGLVALGIVTREEIDWALASQFDIPFIFPNADAVDREAARVVPADWALAHMAVPIVKSGGSLTFVVADPLHRETIQELRARTGCEIEMALASATRIRELIHAVYDATQSERVEGAAAMSLGDFLAQAVDRGAERFGISVRGNSAVAWWRSRGETHRAPLQDGWNSALGESLEPSVDDRIAGLTEGQVDWNPALRRAGSSVQLTARAMVGVGGYELMFRPSDEPPAAAAVTALPQTLVT